MKSKSLLLISMLLLTLIASADEESIGYPSVKQAIEGLIDTPGAEMTIQKIEGKPVIWSFTAQNRYAYSTAAKREIRQDDEAGM